MHRFCDVARCALLALALAATACVAPACSKETPKEQVAPSPARADGIVEQGQTQPAPTKDSTMLALVTHSLSPDHAKSIFDSPVKTLRGDSTNLGSLKGKALLLVNVASECGSTPQYEKLEALQKKYAERGFAVVGFPCNQFGGQEPGTAEEIATFCSTTYGVTFPMMEKIEVNGNGRHPIYAALTSYADAKDKAGDVQWNFEKFLISADATQITRFRTKVEPDDPALVSLLEASLPKK